MSARHRRSRIYDANFSLGESYYKSAIDTLDRKTTKKSDSTEVQSTALSVPRPQFDFNGDLYNDDLNSARQRASKAIQEKTVFDSRGSKIVRATGLTVNETLENEFDDEVQSSINRLRASKKLINDLDYDSAVDQYNSNSSNNRSSSLVRRQQVQQVSSSNRAESLNNSESTAVIKRRAIKVVSSANDVADASSLTKWTKLPDAETFATQRALATKARLNDIENELIENSERTIARDRRAAHIKKILSDATEEDMCSGIKSIKITQRAERKLVSY